MEQLTEILEQVWTWIQSNPDIVTNGAAGAVLGPILSKLLKGGAATGTLAGLAGGVAAGFGIDQTQFSTMIGDEGLMKYVQNIVEGALGGGVLGGAAGVATKRK